METNEKPPVSQNLKLLDQMRHIFLVKHYSLSTEKSYVGWIQVHNKRHPKEMSEKEINEFLTHLAVKERVAVSTQIQALCAIISLQTCFNDRASRFWRYYLGKKTEESASCFYSYG